MTIMVAMRVANVRGVHTNPGCTLHQLWLVRLLLLLLLWSRPACRCRVVVGGNGIVVVTASSIPLLPLHGRRRKRYNRDSNRRQVSTAGSSSSVTTTTTADATATAAGRRSRVVQEVYPDEITASSSTEPCVATTAIDYINRVLGPSSDQSSLYNTVVLENIDLLGNALTIRIRELAQALLEDNLRNGGTSSSSSSSSSNGASFVQQEQYFGRLGGGGEQTDELLQQHMVWNQFWGAPEPVLLVGLHSEPLYGNLEQAISAWLVKEGQLTNNDYLQNNVTTETIQQLTLQVRTAIETELPSNYSNPALTYIAYYAPRFGVQGINVDSSSSVVVLGDGYLDFYQSLSLSVVGADMLHAHEYSHALHFVLDVADVNGNLTAYVQNFLTMRTPAIDRRYELEADAMGAYALAHPYGRYWNVSLLRQAARAMYTIGDCQVTQAFHHGTPLQRQCATLWGADEAVGDDNDGDDVGGNGTNGTAVTTARRPLSPRAFRQAFSDHLALILALDPTVCNLTDENGRVVLPLPTPTIEDETVPPDSTTQTTSTTTESGASAPSSRGLIITLAIVGIGAVSTFLFPDLLN